MPFILERSAFLFITYQYGKSKYVDRRSGAIRHYIHYVQSGRGKIITAGQTLEVKAGDLIYIPMGISMESYWYGTETEDAVLCSCGTTFFPEAEKESFGLQKLPGKFVSRFLEIPLNLVPDSHALSLFFSLLSDLAGYMRTQPTQEISTVFQKLQSYILQNNHHCKVPDMAKHLGISTPSLYNLFKPTGKTPNQFRQEVLLDWAIYMLRASGSSIQAVCDYVGFSSVHYLRKCLKEYTGKTPSQLRKE